LAEATDGLNTSLAPIMVEFKGVEASYFAFKRLQYIEKDVDRLMPEIELVISTCWMNLSKFEI
jgi:hypothetical protein